MMALGADNSIEFVSQNSIAKSNYLLSFGIADSIVLKYRDLSVIVKTLVGFNNSIIERQFYRMALLLIGFMFIIKMFGNCHTKYQEVDL